MRYAFTQGMAPWAKESVMLNLPSYGAGMAFHAGVLTAFGLLAAALAGPGPAASSCSGARVLTLAGAAGGLGLLVKRLCTPSCGDCPARTTMLSNLLSSLFALLAFVLDLQRRVRRDSGWPRPSLLLVYAPLGKIRHCLFFFTTRYHLGAFFGRRGTFPPGGSIHA